MFPTVAFGTPLTSIIENEIRRYEHQSSEWARKMSIYLFVIIATGKISIRLKRNQLESKQKHRWLLIGGADLQFH